MARGQVDQLDTPAIEEGVAIDEKGVREVAVGRRPRTIGSIAVPGSGITRTAGQFSSCTAPTAQ